jgi:hypothetical protein
MIGKNEKVSGGCICGAVRYEASVYLHDAYYCHCRMCQKSSGAPAEIAVYVEPGSLRFTRGAPKVYQSSPFGERGFCAICGSRLIWKSIGDTRPEWTNLSVGCLDTPQKGRADIASVRGEPAALVPVPRWPAASSQRGHARTGRCMGEGWN